MNDALPSPERRNVSFGLIAAFLFGLAIGFATGVPLGPTLLGEDAPAAKPTDADEATGAAPEPGKPAGPPAEKPEPASSPDAEPEVSPAPDETPPAEALPAQRPLGDLWPARHLFVSVPGTSLDAATRDALAELAPGGVVLLGGNIEDKVQTASLITEIKDATGLGGGVADLPLIAVDQEGGPVNRLKLEDAPALAELGEEGDVARVRNVASGYAQAARELGIGVVFAPVLDVAGPGAPAALDRRSFGLDMSKVTALGLHFADALLEGGVISVVKHYPGHGGVTEDSHETLPTLELDLEGVRDMMYPFYMSVVYGIPGVMAGHIAVPNLDDAYPASLSPLIADQIVRSPDWGYEGVLITDDLNMGAITETYGLPEAAVLALQAGCDAMIVVTDRVEDVVPLCEAIEEAVEDGRLSRQELEVSKARLDAWQQLLKDPVGLAEPLPEWPPAEPEAGAGNGPTPPEAGDTAPQPDAARVTHEVQTGESLTAIAGRYGASLEEMMRWNDIDDPDTVLVGDELVIYTEDDAAE